MKPPAAVIARLITPQRLSGYGSCAVYNGNGLIAKVGPGATREYHVLSGAAGQLPLHTPRVRDHGSDWVIMDEIPDISSRHWCLDELLDLLIDLAVLHDAFYDRPQEPGNPLSTSLSDHIERLSRHDPGESALLPPALRRTVEDPSVLLSILADSPTTLIHGDPYPSNIRQPRTGVRFWIDWEDAILGPPALDVAAWFLEGPWSLGRPINREMAILTYLAARTVPVDTEAFRRQLDAATILLTPTQNLTELAELDALPGFIAERNAALLRLGLTDPTHQPTSHVG